MLRTFQGDPFKSGPVLKPFAGVDGKHGLTQLSMQAIKNRFSQSGRWTWDYTINDPADSITVFFNGFNERNHFLCDW